LKILENYIPIISFFIIYNTHGIIAATLVSVAVSIIQIIYSYLFNKVENIQLVNFGFIFIFGSLTLILRDPFFIKLKISLVSWTFAGVLLINYLMGKKLILQRIVGDKITFPNHIWKNLTLAWGVFYLTQGFLNLFIMKYMSTQAWVNFKFFGIVLMTLAFIVCQSLLLSKYITKK